MINFAKMKLLFTGRVLIFCVLLQTCGSWRVRRGFCSTRYLDIKNGSYRLRSGNSVVDFSCDEGFQLYGLGRAVCFGSKWSNDPPLCISNTCTKIQPTSILKIFEEYEGAVLTFSCAAMYKLKGERKLICDGTDWNAPTPSCQPWIPPISCDFEDPELCGWTHHDKDDQDWRYNSGKTSTSRTGPSHDHTLGDGGDGHYMYFETSSPTRTDHKAILQSPLYPADYSRGRCFKFWYHILGVGDIGDLEVFFKPESVDDLKTLHVMFHTNENGGDVWYEKSITIPLQSEPFQVLLVATRGTSYRSDFAVDDVSLEDCANNVPPVSNETTGGTVPPTTTNVVTTIRTTQINSSPSKTPEQTTKIVTTGKTTTTKQTTTSTNQTPTPRPTTTIKPATTRLPKTSTTRPTQSSKLTEKSTNKVTTKSNTQQTNSTKTETTQSKQTPEPKINPNLPSREVKHIPGEDRAGPSSIVWVVLGVAIVAVIAGAILFGLVMYRRKNKRHEKLEPLSSTNPLYTAVNGDESTVHFAAIDQDDHGDY